MANSIAYSEVTSNENLRSVLNKLQEGSPNIVFNSAGLAIGTGSKKKVKIVNAIYAYVDGVPLTVAASSEVALSGTVVNAKYNVYVLSVNSAGTVTATMGTDGATLAAVVWPTKPADEAIVGFVIIHPSGTGNFVGATTDLDDGTVVPNAVYVNCTAPFNPNAASL